MWRLPAFWVLVLLAGLSWAGLTVVLNNISPLHNASFAFMVFYPTIFFALSFTFGILLTLVWKIFLPTQASYICLKNGIREGFFVALACTGLLFFLQKDAATWREVVLLFSLVVLVEAFFIEKLKYGK